MFGFTPVLSNHLYVQYFFKYLSFIIGGSIFELISSKRSKSKKMNIVDDNNDNQEKNEKEILERNNSGSVLIFNDQIEKVKTKNFKDIIGCSSFSLSLEIPWGRVASFSDSSSHWFSSHEQKPSFSTEVICGGKLEFSFCSIQFFSAV